MSTFAKDCPRCGATNAAYAVSCRCGFAFNSLDHADQEESDASVTLQEEELYLEYLRARAQQAEENAAATQSQQAQAAAKRAQAELEQQRARMKVMHVVTDDNTQKQERSPSTPSARPQPLAPSASTTTSPAKPGIATPIPARKEAVPAVTKSAATPPLAERKEPATATVKSSAPAAKGGETTRPAPAKSPHDVNKYIPGPDNARATTAAESAGPLTEHPKPQTQPKIPTAPAVKPETKAHASAPAPAGKVISSTTAVPAKTENVSDNKQTIAGGASTAANSVRPADKDAAASQAAGAAEVSDKPNVQRDTVPAKAAAAAARAKQLAEALKAAQAERGVRTKTGVAIPNPTRNDSKTGDKKPTTGGASTATAKAVPASVQAPKSAPSSATGPTIAKPVNGQQQKLNGQDKSHVDIGAIHIPGTDSQDNKVELDKTVPEQSATAPATVAKHPDARTPSAGDTPVQRVPETPQPMADDRRATAPVKTTPGVTVTVAPGADPQEELEAALKALSPRAPVPPAQSQGKAPATVGDAGVASSETGKSPAPAAGPTSTPDELPSLEPVAPADQKDCPNCTALLPLETKRCRCGFRFPEVEERMPGLSLSDSDFAALDGDTSSTGITHLS